MKPSRETVLGLYATMLKIRCFEEKIVDLYAKGLVPGLAHLYIGQEAVAAGVCALLDRGDYITSTHRGHGHVIAKGADINFMMAELFGKKTGYCKGKGGSMHIADVDLGILGANGIAGGGLPIAVGAALSAKWRGTDRVSVCFFGDGSSNNGTFHESLNLASLHGLPVVFVCENNCYGISVCQAKHQPIVDISLRASSYAMPGVTADGNDVLAVMKEAEVAVRRARSGGGPTLLEFKTYRWRGHHEGDPNQGARYRTKEEIEAWKAKDPIARLGRHMIEKKLAKPADLDRARQDAEAAMDAAVAFANQSPFPEIGELHEDVYAAAGGAR